MRFPIQPGTHDNLTKGIRWWLENHTDHHCHRHPENKYKCTEEFVLKEGFAVNSHFGEMTELPDMPLGKCFDNAWEVSQERQDQYWYCEGWAIMDHGLPTHHAWLLNIHTKKVHDPTWRGFYNRKKYEHPEEPWTDCAVYWGIFIPPSKHIRWALKTNYPNLLAVYEKDCDDVLKLGMEAFNSL